MKLNLKTLVALAGLGATFGLVASLSTPVDTGGFELLGGQLGAGQRDFRVFNNFNDTQSNNNTNEHPNFPGVTGAVLAFSKAVHEWGSEWRGGNGGGDPTQPHIGSGGANFDSHYQGIASGAGGANANIISALSQSGGGTFAFMQGPISDGWTIKFFDGNWTWADGPNTIPGAQVDLQEVCTHEYGHALGLDHTGVGGSTMTATTSPGAISGRSIGPDDIAGLQAIYGVKVGNKPKITDMIGDKSPGGIITITGENFDDDNNQIWFSNPGNNGVATKVSNVSSDGTTINVTVPAGIIDGDLLVKNQDESGGESLSNAWPFATSDGAADPPYAADNSPTTGPAGGFTEVVITGLGFNGVSNVQFGGVDALSFNVDTGTQLTVIAPPGPAPSSVDIVVIDPDGTSTLAGGFSYSFNPAVNIDDVSPSEGPEAGGETVTITGPNVLGANAVKFGGVDGTNIQILSPNELTVETPPGTGTVDVMITGAGLFGGSDTLVGAYTYTTGVNLGDFVDIGPGIGGSLGPPTMTGDGDLTPGSATGYTISIGNTPPNAFGIWFWAFGNGGSAPFKQGTFYPLPILIQVAFNMPPTGEIDFPLSWDNTIPGGISFTMQFWCQDATAPAGAGGTNGLRMDLP